MRVGQGRVRRLMKLHGIHARGKKKFVVTTDSKHNLPIAENLLARNFAPEAPNRVWTNDITCIATDKGGLFLAAVIDLFSRHVVSWRMSPYMQPWGTSAPWHLSNAGMRPSSKTECPHNG